MSFKPPKPGRVTFRAQECSALRGAREGTTVGCCCRLMMSVHGRVCRHVCRRGVGPLLAVSGQAEEERRGGKVCLHRRQTAWGIVGERKSAGSVSACSNFLLRKRKSPGSYFSPAQQWRAEVSMEKMGITQASP